MHRQSLTRREFATRVTLGAAAVPLAVGPVGALASDEAQNSAQSPEKQAKAAAEPTQKPAEAKPPTQAELLLDVVRLRYPDERLTDDVLEHIRGDIEADLFRAAAIANCPLRNSDAPAYVFSAYRKD
jgi:hypothetical protein